MSDRRIALRCPGCGAPLPAAAATSAVVCVQCGMASESAPRGPERIVQTVVVERVVVRDSDAHVAAVRCPRCKVGLFAAMASDVTVHGCSVCGGIWIDNAGSQAIARRVNPQIGVLAARAEKHAAFPQPSSSEHLECPLCQKQMQRVNAGLLAELDICGEHGTWFDAGELRRVMAAYSKYDDPLAPIVGRRDPVEEQLAHVARQNQPPPDPWEFSGPTASRIVDGGLDILGALLAQPRSPR